MVLALMRLKEGRAFWSSLLYRPERDQGDESRVAGHHYSLTTNCCYDDPGVSFLS